MKPFGVSIYEEMRNVQKITREKTEEAIGKASEAYDATLAQARQEAGVTNDPVCVPCSYCGAEVGAECQTKSGNETTPHSPRNYDYEQAVKQVHQSPVVKAAKRRYDELKRVQDEAEYEEGRYTSNVRVQKNSTLVCMARQSPGPKVDWLGYKPLYAANVLGMHRDTLFSHAELNYMISIGVDVHLIGESFRDAIVRFLEPPDVREEKRRQAEREAQVAAIEKAQRQAEEMRLKHPHFRPSPVPTYHDHAPSPVDMDLIRMLVRMVLDEEKDA